MFDLRFTMSDPRDDFIDAREEITRQIIRPVIKLKVLSALDTLRNFTILQIFFVFNFLFLNLSNAARVLCAKVRMKITC